MTFPWGLLGMARLVRVAMSASSSVASRRVAVLCDTCRASAKQP